LDAAVSHHSATVSQDLLATLGQFSVLAFVSHDILDVVSQYPATVSQDFTGNSQSVSNADHCKPRHIGCCQPNIQLLSAKIYRYCQPTFLAGLFSLINVS
jgi:hypothetical protein